MRRYKITASAIGPYFPIDEVKIGDFVIKKVDRVVSNEIPPKIQANSVDEALVSISQDIIFDSGYIVEWEREATSSKTVYQQAKIELDELLSCLNIPVSSYKYFSKIVNVEHLNPEESGPDPESPSSDPVHVIGYIPGRFLDENIKFYDFLLSTKESEIKRLRDSFYVGIKEEVLLQGNSDMTYYKILEEISQIVLKRFNTDTGQLSNYNLLLEELKTVLVEKGNEEQKVIKVKEYANKLRALDFEQIGERIILAARKFNLKPEIIETLKKINIYRARILAHPGKPDAGVKLDDPRDIREMARIFILHYLNKFCGLKIPDYGEVTEKDAWYMHNYARSDAKMDKTSEVNKK